MSNVYAWQSIHSLLCMFTNLQWQRVRAHSGNTWNEKVDRLARGQAEKIMRAKMLE